MRVTTIAPQYDDDEEQPEPTRMPAFDSTSQPSFVKNAADMPTSTRFWERSIPDGDLAGWRVQIVYPFENEDEGGIEELRWAEGFVIDCLREPATNRVQIRVYFPEDEYDDHWTLPDIDVAFHIAGPSATVPQSRVRAARDAVVEEA